MNKVVSLPLCPLLESFYRAQYTGETFPLECSPPAPFVVLGEFMIRSILACQKTLTSVEKLMTPMPCSLQKGNTASSDVLTSILYMG